MWSFFFFFVVFFSFAISFVLSFPGATKTCTGVSFSRLDKSAPSQRVIFSLFFFPKKKVQTLGSFLPTKTKKIWQKYLSDPHAFLSSLLHINHPILSKLLRRFCDHVDRISLSIGRARAPRCIIFFSLSPKKEEGCADRRAPKPLRGHTRGILRVRIHIRLCPFWKTRGRRRRPEASGENSGE